MGLKQFERPLVLLYLHIPGCSMGRARLLSGKVADLWVISLLVQKAFWCHGIRYLKDLRSAAIGTQHTRSLQKTASASHPTQGEPALSIWLEAWR